MRPEAVWCSIKSLSCVSLYSLTIRCCSHLLRIQERCAVYNTYLIFLCSKKFSSADMERSSQDKLLALRAGAVRINALCRTWVCCGIYLVRTVYIITWIVWVCGCVDLHVGVCGCVCGCVGVSNTCSLNPMQASAQILSCSLKSGAESQERGSGYDGCLFVSPHCHAHSLLLRHHSTGTEWLQCSPHSSGDSISLYAVVAKSTALTSGEDLFVCSTRRNCHAKTHMKMPWRNFHARFCKSAYEVFTW